MEAKGERIYLIDLSAAYLIWDLSGATTVNERWKETDLNGFFYVTVLINVGHRGLIQQDF